VAVNRHTVDLTSLDTDACHRYSSRFPAAHSHTNLRAQRADGTLTIMIINIALAMKTKALRIDDQAQVRAETWLFDPTLPVENPGIA
jgi:hypothetical protein